MASTILAFGRTCGLGRPRRGQSCLSCHNSEVLSFSRIPRKVEFLPRAGHFVGRGGRMTTWWRPDLKRIRAEIAAEAEQELEVKVEASDGDGATQGTKRKRAPPTKGPCEHGVKYRSQCKVCSACPHGRQRSKCKECGGKGICEHDRRRNRCKECGGSSFCEHGRQSYSCKECGGSAFCEHGRQRSRCKECGGSSICEHGRARCVCKECGGGSICEHGRRRYRCKDCRGSC